MTTKDRNAIFILSSHSGVIYDYEYRRQTILQGHCAVISCCAVSNDKRWIVTSDIGSESILVVWDSYSGSPIKTLFSPHFNGVCSLDISQDSLYIVTLGAASLEKPQELAIWAWTKESDVALLRSISLVNELQTHVRFSIIDHFEIVTTGAKYVSFWNWENFRLEGYIGKVSKGEFGNFSGSMLCSIFLNNNNAITATDEGYVILWENQASAMLLDRPEKVMRAASKIVCLIESGISTMTTVNGYLVVGSKDGAVRFYDFFLRLEAWFEDLSAGPVTSISFSIQDCPLPETEAGSPGLSFWVPDFTVSTSDALIIGVESMLFNNVRPEDRRGTLLLQGMADEIVNICCHPTLSLLVVACAQGSLQVWDYELKLLLNLRELNSRDSKKIRDVKNTHKPTTLSFDPLGFYLAVGLTSGQIKILTAESLEDLCILTPTTCAICHLSFSQSGSFLACSDSDGRVILFRRHGDDGISSHTKVTVSKDRTASVYTVIGRCKAHTGAICDLIFGSRDGAEVLFSVGVDRRCQEYDLKLSSVAEGIVSSEKSVRIEVSSRPTALMWYPRAPDDVEDRFVIVNDEFKFKEFNTDSKQCRKTTNAPMFGGPITKLLAIGNAKSIDSTFYAYSTAERIVGVGTFPLVGNPENVMGLVAHPTTISNIASSHDGKYLFTSGGKDLSVNMWAIDVSVLGKYSQSQQADEMSSFYEMLEGGFGGELYNDIIDYFYYCQLRNQGEDSMEPRVLTGKIPLDQIPYLVRAIGYYPSEDEITNMINEVRFADFMTTGNLRNDIGLVLRHSTISNIFR